MSIDHSTLTELQNLRAAFNGIPHDPARTKALDDMIAFARLHLPAAHRYRKIDPDRPGPEIVEAFQWFGNDTQIEDPVWCAERIAAGAIQFHGRGTDEVRLLFNHNCALGRGGWLMLDSKGELWGASAEEFAELFEMLPDPELVPYESSADTLRHIKRVCALLSFAAVELLSRGIVHDDSKLSDPEKAYFDTYTPRLRGMTYGSPEYKQCLSEMQPALVHHNAANRHHPEHWAEAGVNGMDLFDLLEMLLDWKAASERHADGDINRSIEVNTERFGLSSQLATILMNTVPWLLSLPAVPNK